MTFFSWKTLRLLVIGGIIAGNVWLVYWVIPTIGCFHVKNITSDNSDTFLALVSVFNGTYSHIVSLSHVTTGWKIIKELWPLILLGVMLGYPIGQVVKRRVSLEELQETARCKKGFQEVELFLKEGKVRAILDEAISRTKELPQLRETEKKLRQELYTVRRNAGEQKKLYESAVRKAEKLEKELVNARTKNRRQQNKKSQR